MSVESGGARPFLVAAVAAAVALTVLALGVVVLTSPSPVVDGEPSSIPSPAASDSAPPSEPPAGMANCAVDPPSSPAAGEDQVFVFFGCATPPAPPQAVVRKLGAVEDPASRLAAALEALVAGPTPEEAAAGYWAPLPSLPGLVSGVELQPDGLAILDLAAEYREIPNVTASAAGGAVLRSIRATALQFPEVTAVELRLEGSCEAFAGFMGAADRCVHLAEPAEQVSDCPIWPPTTLPSGAPLTQPRPYRDLGGLVSWGSTDDTMTLSVSHRDSIGLDQVGKGGEPLTVAGRPGWAVVAPAEIEPGITRPLLAWDDGAGCVYAAYLAPGATSDDLHRAARLFTDETRP